jgi:hypothetical protein
MVGTRVPTGTRDGDRLPSSNSEIPQISLLLGQRPRTKKGKDGTQDFPVQHLPQRR